MAVTKNSGTWADGTEVNRPTNAGGNPRATLLGIACPSVGRCTAVGSYASRSAGLQSMATSQRIAPPQPKVTVVSPTFGPVTGGNTVTISGANLSGTSRVAFGLKTASHFTVVSPTKIRAVAPAEVAGSVSITVTTEGGASTKTRAGLYRFEPPA
jgi:IPT/TIG domain